MMLLCNQRQSLLTISARHGCFLHAPHGNHATHGSRSHTRRPGFSRIGPLGVAAPRVDRGGQLGCDRPLGCDRDVGRRRHSAATGAVGSGAVLSGPQPYAVESAAGCHALGGRRAAGVGFASQTAGRNVWLRFAGRSFNRHEHSAWRISGRSACGAYALRGGGA